MVAIYKDLVFKWERKHFASIIKVSRCMLCIETHVFIIKLQRNTKTLFGIKRKRL